MFYTATMKAEYREEPCRNALNRVQGMPFKWSLNPYMGCAHRCTFCYVRAFELRAGRPSDSRYGSSIRVKVNAAEVLRRELTRRSWKQELVAIGAATDPYQPAEGRYRLTRACLGVLAEAHNPFSIISRGPLMVRDIDVLQDASRRAGVSVTFSIPTLDDRVWRTTEPGTAHPRNRLRAVSMLAQAGIDVSVGIAPVLPGLSDSVASIDRVVRAARDAGARNVWTRVLYLPPGTREHFLEQLGRDWPDHVPEYEELYRGRAYLAKDQDARIQAIVRERRAASGFGPPQPFRSSLPEDGRPRESGRRPLPVGAQAQRGL
jgi:DNA repair photolyase